MKMIFKLYILILCLSPFSIIAQVSEGVNYQAMYRNSQGTALPNRKINVTIFINQGSSDGLTVYEERHKSKTNGQGLFNIVVGNGFTTDDFSAIDWSFGPYFMSIYIEDLELEEFIDFGVQQILSVPYALHAKVADSIAGGSSGLEGPQGPPGEDGQDGAPGLPGADGQDGQDGQDGADGQGGVTSAGTNVTITGSGVQSDPYVINATDDQNLTGANLNGTELQIDIDNGNSATVDLSTLQDGTGTDDQDLTEAVLNGTTLDLSIEDGNGVSVDLSPLQDGVIDADNDPTNELNTGAALNNNILEIQDAGGAVSVDLSALDNSGTDDQNISGSSLTGTILKIGIENGASEIVDLSPLQDGVDDADNDPTNEIQILSFSNDTLYLSNGGQIYLGDYSNQNLSLNDLSDASTEGVDQSFATPNDKNVFVGLGSGENVQTGYNNTALGYNTLNQLVGQTPSGNTNNRENVAIGFRSQENSRGAGNTSLGAYSLMNNTLGLTWNGFSYGGGNFNTAIGYSALINNESGTDNVGIGPNALYNLTQGIRNIGIGRSPGQDLTNGSNNIFLGFLSGEGQTNGSYKLYIDNSEYNDPNPPLIFGEFGNGNNNEPFLDFGGDVNVFDTLTTPYFVLSDGATNGYILQSDASGNANWVDPLTVETLNDNDWALSGNDMYSLPTGNVGIGTSIPNATLEVSGSARITNLSGTGDRMVITNSAGDLSSEDIPVNTDNQDLLYNPSSYQLTIINGNTVDLGSLNDSKWSRNNSNSSLYPSNTNDKIGLGTNTPSTKLDVVGVLELSNVTPTDPGSDIVRLGDGGSQLQIQTNYGYTKIGPQNSSYAHFNTDRSKYYFDKRIIVDEGILSSYNEDLSLQTSQTERIRINNSNGYVGIGTSTPSVPLHVSGSLLKIRLESSSIGQSAISNDIHGLELVTGGMNSTSSMYGSSIKFMSDDSNFSTNSPRLLAGIFPRATETYSGDDDGGMAIEFRTSPINPGASSNPIKRMTIADDGNIEIEERLGFSDPTSVAPYTYTSTLTTRSEIPSIGINTLAWQDEYMALGFQHRETNFGGQQYLIPGITLKDGSLIDDWMVVLIAGSGGDDFSSTDLGDYAIVNFTSSNVSGGTWKWLGPDGLFGSTIGADKQFYIEDAEFGVGSRIFMLYKKNQSEESKYSPMYRITYIASGNINNDGMDIITTIEATYHDVDPNN